MDIDGPAELPVATRKRQSSILDDQAPKRPKLDAHEQRRVVSLPHQLQTGSSVADERPKSAGPTNTSVDSLSTPSAPNPAVASAGQPASLASVSYVASASASNITSAFSPTVNLAPPPAPGNSLGVPPAVAPTVSTVSATPPVASAASLAGPNNSTSAAAPAPAPAKTRPKATIVYHDRPVQLVTGCSLWYVPPQVGNSLLIFSFQAKVRQC